MGENKSSDMQNNSSHIDTGLDRFAMFNIYIKNAIEELSSGVSEEQYMDLFGKLSALKKSKSAPGKMQKRMKTNIMNSLITEIEAMTEEENLQKKMCKLDKLVEESTLDEGKETWRPNGNVDDHLRSYAMAVKLKHKSFLEECARERVQATEGLRQQVSRCRDQVNSMKAKLQTLQSSDCTLIHRMDAFVTEKVEDLSDC